MSFSYTFKKKVITAITMAADQYWQQGEKIPSCKEHQVSRNHRIDVETPKAQAVTEELEDHRALTKTGTDNLDDQYFDRSCRLYVIKSPIIRCRPHWPSRHAVTALYYSISHSISREVDLSERRKIATTRECAA